AEIAEYSGERKDIGPVTIATYQILISKQKGIYKHFEVFDAEDWGLVIYDEVHLLPAPVFCMTADIETRRRRGLSATLVPADGRRTPRRTGHHGQDADARAREAVRRVPGRRAQRARGVEGGELLDRLARSDRGDPGVRHVRQPAGGGATPWPDPAPQGRRPA